MTKDPVPAARPEDGTTRYLCAAAHRYQLFSDTVLEEFLVEQVRAVPPSPGLDSAAVLREAVAARRRRRVRDGVLLTLLAALTLLNPVAVVLWLLVASVMGKPRSKAGAVRRRMVAIVLPVAALLLVVALPIVKAATGVGLPPGDRTWWPSALIGLLLLVVRPGHTGLTTSKSPICTPTSLRPSNRCVRRRRWFPACDWRASCTGNRF